MAKVISGYAESGGSSARQGSIVQRASEDLEANLNGAAVQAITAYSDSAGLHLIAVCEGKSKQADSKKKGGK